MNRYAAVVLAAGQATRYRSSGGAAPTKMVAVLDGKPLVRHVVETACQSPAQPVIVVTGHAWQAVETALAGLPAGFVHNPDFASGLAGSLRRGVAAVPPDAAGALILLGDMPLVTAGLIGCLIAAAETVPEADAVVPVTAGRRGNPVVLSRRLFPALAGLAGDAGARHLLRLPSIRVHEVMVDDEAAALDIDDAGDLVTALR